MLHSAREKTATSLSADSIVAPVFLIGGILSSTILTLLVLPMLYRLTHGKQQNAHPAATPAWQTTRSHEASQDETKDEPVR
jgi:hypothetical protein